MSKNESLLRAWKVAACWLAFLEAGCGAVPVGEGGALPGEPDGAGSAGGEGAEQDPLSDAAATETVVTVATDGSITQSSGEITDELPQLEAEKLARAGAGSSAGPLGTLSQRLIVATACASSDLWLYDAGGNRLCVRWDGGRERGLDLASIRRGDGICAINASTGRGIPCNWANAVTAFWPGQDPGNLGNCVRHDISLTCAFPIHFASYGPYSEVDGSNINWLTLAN